MTTNGTQHPTPDFHSDALPVNSPQPMAAAPAPMPISLQALRELCERSNVDDPEYRDIAARTMPGLLSIALRVDALVGSPEHHFVGGSGRAWLTVADVRAALRGEP